MKKEPYNMETPDDFSYQFTAIGKSNKMKGGKAYSSKSGKRANSSKGSKHAGKYEPIRNLRATLDQVDLDRGAKPSKRLR